MLKLLAAAVVIVLAAIGFLMKPGASPVDRPAPTVVPATPGAGDQTVIITEAMLDDGPATLMSVQTHLANGQIQANGDAAVGSSTVPVSMSSRVDLQNGKPVVTVQDARAAGVPVPDATKTSVQQAMQSELDQQVQLAQMNIKSVAVTDGKLVFIGTHRT